MRIVNGMLYYSVIQFRSKYWYIYRTYMKNFFRFINTVSQLKRVLFLTLLNYMNDNDYLNK